ncbi:MAG: ABC-type spermidine/putrescine transport system permease subunit I [Gammaproteobacteria bacterium]|jgi:ABC-type spermidine/putrescine transport system permease subunit I
MHSESNRGRWLNLIWLLPVLVLYAVGLVFPLAITVQRAIEHGVSGWSQLFSNSLFTGAASNTLYDSSLIMVTSIVLAYSVAAAIWRSGPMIRTVLIAIVVITFWLTVLVKIVAFNALLRDNGVLNTLLIALGFIDTPIRMFPGRIAMIVGMIQFALPFAIFPILGVMMKLDRQLEKAAESLGGSPISVFIHVTLPLTMPGIIASALLVFVICTGFYVIPAALGTPRDQLLANVVAIYALELLDFRTASAIGVILIVLVSFLTVLYQRAESRVQ